jgi:hypothetical protein
MSSGTTNSLYGVWGSSSSDVFAAGLGGTIFHYEGMPNTTSTTTTTSVPFGCYLYISKPLACPPATSDLIISTSETSRTQQAALEAHNATQEFCAGCTDCFPAPLWSEGTECYEEPHVCYNPTDLYFVVCQDGYYGLKKCSDNTFFISLTWDVICGEITTTTTAMVTTSTTTIIPTTTTTVSTTTTAIPTVVALLDFNVVSGNRIVILTWSTAGEIDNAGFNLYRSTAEDG